MEMVAKISKGSKMDQIYLPKDRIGLSTGQYVIITPLEKNLEKEIKFKPYFYNIHDIEPLKLSIIKDIFNILESIKPKNIIITGSFLENGFKFNDIDILIISDEKIETEKIKRKIEAIIKIKTHLIVLKSKTLITGLSIDPLYVLMLSKCIAKKRFVFKTKKKINYKYLDLQLLKSKTLIENFYILNGTEKYYLTFNMFAILLFIKKTNLTREIIDKSIEEEFNIKIKDLRDNLIKKDKFIKKYKQVYDKLFNLILEGINEQK